MKTLTTLKTLPLIGLLAMGLALAPVASMADDNDRGRGKDRVYQKHGGGKGQNRDGGKSHRRDKGHVERGHGFKSGYNRANKHVQKNHGGHGHKKQAYKHHGHSHNVYRPHSHSRGHGHKHADYVVVHDNYRVYDPFRLMLGLHFDNIDIIYRDF